MLLAKVHQNSNRRSAIAIGALMIGACLARGADEQKDHVLFVGTDFGVLIKGQEYQVVDAGNRTVVFEDGGRRKEKPLRELPNINIHRGLKLTNVTAQIDKVEAVLTSDATNADIADQTFNVMAMQTMADMARDHAYGQMVDADVGRAGVGSSQLLITGHDISVANAEQSQSSAFQNVVIAERLRASQQAVMEDLFTSTATAEANDGTEVEITPEMTHGAASLSVTGETPHTKSAPEQKKVTKAVIDAGNGRSDHLDVEFTISSPTPLESAYVAITTEYTIPKSNEVFRRILTERVGRIDAAPKKISIYETNYPEGFHLRTYLIAIYANGQEVATNLSETKMTMTRDEAYQYLMVDYIASHRGQTRPPAAVLMASRADLRQAIASAPANRPIYVSVDQDGNVVKISSDQTGRHGVDPSLRDALEKFRFIPALEKGVPTAGRAQLVVADFAR
jgi:hypothetical protein